MGPKNWITNGGTASVYLDRTNGSFKKFKGHQYPSLLKKMAGVTVAAKEISSGFRGSDTHSILFNDVKCRKKLELVKKASGLSFAMKTLARWSHRNCFTSPGYRKRRF
jgi:alkylation response protein AidB-like acyl-CoA dehydrogenase